MGGGEKFFDGIGGLRGWDMQRDRFLSPAATRATQARLPYLGRQKKTPICPETKSSVLRPFYGLLLVRFAHPDNKLSGLPEGGGSFFLELDFEFR